VVISSRGTTHILLRGATVWVPQPVPKDDPADSDHVAGVKTFGFVYANEAARAALKASPSAPKFPAGSAIVRETRAQAEGGPPLLLVAMVKRAAGFNPKGGDWEFLSIDPGLKKVEARQKKGSCLDCHASQRERDFVFPATLPTPAP
jgi:hypothetical protein